MISFFYHQWLEFSRSLNWKLSLFVNIFQVALAIFIMSNLIGLGYYIDVLIESVYPESSVINCFTELFLFYLLFDFYARFMFQKLPSLNIQPYLALPITKQKLIHYPLLKSAFGFFNFFALCLVVPFFIKVVVPLSCILFSIAWLVSVLALIFATNFFVLAFKYKFSSNPIVILSFVMILGVLIYVRFWEINNFTGHFSGIFLLISNRNYGVFISLILLGASYIFAYRTLFNNHRPEDTTKLSLKSTTGLSLIDNYSQTGSLLALELKMILRNKRPKTALLYGLLMIPYGFLLYSMNSDDDLLQLTIGFLIISGAAMPYGQFFYSWQSSHFDGLMTQNVNVYSYIKSKFYIFTLLSLVSYTLTLPFVFSNEFRLIAHSGMVLYTIGISSFLVLYFGCFKSKPISLVKNQMISFDGVSLIDAMTLLPVLGIPAILYSIFVAMDITFFFIYALGLLGVVGLLLNRILLRYIARVLIKQKYNIGVGFRNNKL